MDAPTAALVDAARKHVGDRMLILADTTPNLATASIEDLCAMLLHTVLSLDIENVGLQARLVAMDELVVALANDAECAHLMAIESAREAELQEVVCDTTAKPSKGKVAASTCDYDDDEWTVWPAPPMTNYPAPRRFDHDPDRER
jgi:hypothetical protein